MLLPIGAGKGGRRHLPSGTQPRHGPTGRAWRSRLRIRAAPPGPVAEGLGQVPFQGGRDFGDGDPAPGFGRQRGHPGVGNAARDDAVIPGQVAVAVQRQPVHGDAPGHPCADRPDLAVGRALDPGAAAPRHPDRGHPEIGAGPDHGLFQRPHVGDHVDRLAELDDRVAGQLPGPVPGDLAAAVHVDDRRPGSPKAGQRRPSACPPCTRARARAAGSCPEPRRPPAARGRAAAGPSPPCSPPGRDRGPGTQARSLFPAYARPNPGKPARPSRKTPGGDRRTIIPGRKHNENVIDEAELRRMSADERRQLARVLAELDGPDPAASPRTRARWPTRTSPTRSCAVSAGWRCSSRPPAA